MNFKATTGIDLHTLLVKNQHNGLSLTLKFRSNFKTFSNSLGIIFLYPVNIIFGSKTNSKEVIEH
jgi:hypothetical protein